MALFIVFCYTIIQLEIISIYVLFKCINNVYYMYMTKWLESDEYNVQSSKQSLIFVFLWYEAVCYKSTVSLVSLCSFLHISVQVFSHNIDTYSNYHGWYWLLFCYLPSTNPPTIAPKALALNNQDTCSMLELVRIWRSNKLGPIDWVANICLQKTPSYHV
jgi:hypothetical protein